MHNEDKLLRKKIIRIAYDNPVTRPYLLPLLQRNPRGGMGRYAFLKAAEGDVRNFLEEYGDQKVKNPNPKSRDAYPEVKIKSLPNSEEGKGVFRQIFERWKTKAKKDPVEKQVDRLRKQVNKMDDQELWEFTVTTTDIPAHKGEWKTLSEADRRRALDDMYQGVVQNVAQRYFEKHKNPKKNPSPKDLMDFYDKSRGSLFDSSKYLDKYLDN